VERRRGGVGDRGQGVGGCEDYRSDGLVSIVAPAREGLQKGWGYGESLPAATIPGG
jgi:hypothetical protein